VPQPIAEQLRAILESTADGLLVVDEEGKVSHSNGRFAELWRIPADVLASRDDRKLLSYVLDQLVDPEAFVSKVEQLYTSREEELDVLRFKDGRVFERFSSPLMHEDQVTGRVWSFRDVTARRQAQNALRVSEQRFRTMYNEAPVMIHSLDREGRIIEVSDHWLKTLGYSREEVVGREATDFLTKGSREHVENGTLPRFWKSGRAKDVSYQFVRSDGEVIDVLLTAIAQRGPDGEYLRSLAVSLDVTERNRAAEEKERLEEQIRHAQKLESLGILAGGIAHDFNNLLVAIMGNSDLALMSLGDNEQARVCIDDVVKASQRAADLCRQLLAYSGKGQFTVQPVDLSEVVREMGDLLEVSISKRAELRYGLASDLPAVDADLTQLRQVMMNLITNSADAMMRPRFRKRTSTTSSSRAVTPGSRSQTTGWGWTRRRCPGSSTLSTAPSTPATGSVLPRPSESCAGTRAPSGSRASPARVRRSASFFRCPTAPRWPWPWSGKRTPRGTPREPSCW
jgi:PAS domain S-box-containing protein